MNRQRLHEIVESVKEDYLLNTIEETTGEVEVLRTKKFLNETSALVERMLLEAEEDGEPSFMGKIQDKIQDYYSRAKQGIKNATLPNGAPVDKIAGRDIPGGWLNFANQAYPRTTALGAAGLGAAGLGGLGYAGYEAMQPDSMMDQAADYASSIGG